MSTKTKQQRTPRNIRWTCMYEQLNQYYQNHGNVDNVPYSIHDPELNKLARWNALQRQRYRNGTLSDCEQELLNKLNFRWLTTQPSTKKDAKWNEQYKKLTTYRKQSGCTRFLPSKNRELSLWVANQRKLHAAKKLKQDRVDLLNKIGFRWVVAILSPRHNTNEITQYDKKWNVMYEKLKQYKHRFGHPNVPSSYKDDPSLAVWVANRRRLYHHKCWNDQLQISSSRKQLLEDLDFQWTVFGNESRK